MISYNEINGDLFKKADSSYTLVHCVSADGAMEQELQKRLEKISLKCQIMLKLDQLN